MSSDEIDYNLLEIEKGNRRYGAYLKNHIQDLQKEKRKLQQEIERLNNIIKEVREYVDKWEDVARYKLLEMLDKGVEE